MADKKPIIINLDPVKVSKPEQHESKNEVALDPSEDSQVLYASRQPTDEERKQIEEEQEQLHEIELDMRDQMVTGILELIRMDRAYRALLYEGYPILSEFEREVTNCRIGLKKLNEVAKMMSANMLKYKKRKSTNIMKSNKRRKI